MSDRCSLWLITKKEHARAVCLAFGVSGRGEWDPMDYLEDLGHDLVQFEDPEVNSGGGMYLQSLGAKGIPYVGGHGRGSDYEAFAFCCDGRTMGEHVDVSGLVIGLVWEDGKVRPDESELSTANTYVQLEQRARKALGIPEPKDPLSWNVIELISEIGDADGQD